MQDGEREARRIGETQQTRQRRSGQVFWTSYTRPSMDLLWVGEKKIASNLTLRSKTQGQTLILGYGLERNLNELEPNFQAFNLI